MKERPILMNGAMVRATLDGSKTQTRRLVKCHPLINGEFTDEFILHPENHVSDDCPHGKIGDQLWVRETFNGPMWLGNDEPTDSHTPKYCHYAATEAGPPEYMDADDNLVCRWKPSIHMPRWASRIQLEITGVRAERLKNISRGDAMDEGCPFPNMAQGDDPRKWYAELWESINGAGSWDANPLVWAIEFRRIK